MSKKRLEIMDKSVLIVAGGSGVRMGADIPKQFIEIAGTPMLMRTIKQFRNYDPDIHIVLVLPAKHVSLWRDLCLKFDFSVKHQIVEGGQSRFESVKNGLSVVANKGLVAVHDGVRPLISEQTIDRCFKKAATDGNAIPVVMINDSVRLVKEGKSSIVPRNDLRLIQTPQVFKTELIREAYEQNYQEKFTDDASVIESMGYPIYLVEGDEANIKITRPLDLIIAEAYIRKLEAN